MLKREVFYITGMAGAKRPAPATTKMETHINTGTYCEFYIEFLPSAFRHKIAGTSGHHALLENLPEAIIVDDFMALISPEY